MDKQIIIDGVDVSGCYYYSKGKCLGCYMLNEKDCISCYGVCKEINDCHYKQLKRKEQECDELKKIIERLDVPKHEVIDMDVALENEKLKVENEELKKTVDDLLHKPEIQDKILWKIDNEALLGSKDAYIYKLEKTLTEVKKIVGIGLVDGLQPEEYSGFLKILQAQILQKISEVEDG